MTTFALITIHSRGKGLSFNDLFMHGQSVIIFFFSLFVLFLQAVTKEGYLMKQKWKFHQRWRRRYFRLKGHKLYYSKDADEVCLHINQIQALLRKWRRKNKVLVAKNNKINKLCFKTHILKMISDCTSKNIYLALRNQIIDCIRFHFFSSLSCG